MVCVDAQDEAVKEALRQIDFKVRLGRVLTFEVAE